MAQKRFRRSNRGSIATETKNRNQQRICRHASRVPLRPEVDRAGVEPASSWVLGASLASQAFMPCWTTGPHGIMKMYVRLNFFCWYMGKTTETLGLMDIKREKKGERGGRTILEDYSIYIFNVYNEQSPKQRYQMSPRLLKINGALQPHRDSPLEKLYTL